MHKTQTASIRTAWIQKASLGLAIAALVLTCSGCAPSAPTPTSSNPPSSDNSPVNDSSFVRTLQTELDRVGVAAFTESGYKPGRLRHIVLFRYSLGSTQTQRDELVRRFLDLQNSVRGEARYILSIETGPQTSGEGIGQGFEQGFIVTFASEGDRNYYVGEPIVTNKDYYDAQHQAFKQYAGEILAESGALVFDFSVQPSPL